MQSPSFDFQSEVLDRSRTVPVLVDFWASWCSPCRMLTPVLDRLAEKADGRWQLVKINTEEQPEIAREYAVRSIPNVKLFSDGKVIDEFTGALSEYQIEQWLRKALPSPLASMVAEAATEAASGNPAAAERLLGEVLQKEPGNVAALAAMSRLVLFSKPEQAMKLVEALEGEPEHVNLCDAVRTIAPLLVRPETELPSGASRAAYAAAIACLKREDFDGALECFIGVLREDRPYDGDGSRKACIAIFRLLGEDHLVTLKYRRAFDRAF